MSRLKIISWNVNGIRSAANKGLLEFIGKENSDICCFQEIKAWEKQLDKTLSEPKGYFSYFNEANKKGYSGVSVYSKEKPIRITKSLGDNRFDSEGRLLILEFSNFILINIYMPHGGRQKENLEYKLRVYNRLISLLTKLQSKNVILIGDLNIAHTENDLAKPKQNVNNIMFTHEERAQLDKIQDTGFMDTFRIFAKESGHYTWWPYAFNARERNIGWRIDYCFTSSKLKNNIISSTIYKNTLGSDHCPIGLEINL